MLELLLIYNSQESLSYLDPRYTHLKQPEQLQAKRQELLASGARLSPEAMEQVRYWGGGYRNGL